MLFFIWKAALQSQTSLVILGIDSGTGNWKFPFIEECCSYRLKFWCPDFILQSVWGSYWQEGKWGYACCHSFIRNSYCTGDAGKATSASRVGVECTLMWQLHVMSYKGSNCIEVVILGIRRNSRKSTKLNYLTSLNSGTPLKQLK